MNVVPLPARSAGPPRGEWFDDARDGDRALRVSWHADVGCVVLSSWRDATCVATARLSPADTARLIGVLARALASTVGDDAQTGAAVPRQG